MKRFIFLYLILASLTAARDLYDVTTLRTLNLEFSQSNWWQQLTSNYASQTNLLATLVVEDQVYDSVGVRFRGFTSYMMTGTSRKKSFNITVDWKKDQDLMGYETLNLNNCYEDATFMREVLYSNACRQVFPSARANFVKLVINGENWGIYANVQQIDGEFIREWFPSNDGTRWRGEGNFGAGGGGGGRPPGGGGDPFSSGAAALTWQGTDTTQYKSVYTLKSTGQDSPWSSLINTCDVLNNTPLEQLPEALEKVLYIDRALWLCAFEILFHDDDGYISKRGSDYALYFDPETGRINLIQYDANSCMKSRNNEQWSPFLREDDPVVPLMHRLMAIPEYRERYLAHVRTILQSYFNEDYLSPQIDSYRALIENEVQLDGKKIYTYQQFTSGISELKNFIRNRQSYLLANSEIRTPAPVISSVDKNVTEESAGQRLSITAAIGDQVPVKQVNLVLSEDAYGRFAPLPMADDGQHGDGDANDGIYGIETPLYPRGSVLRYYVQAIANDAAGTMSFAPAAEHLAHYYVVTYPIAATTPVVINEFMASNSTTLPDAQGEYDDWIELKNITDETYNLSGMYLSDNLQNPLKWPFPQDTFIEPGGYLLVWADEDGNAESGLHANFKLAAEGELILLFDSDERGNALLDSVSFGIQQTDVSSGYYPDAVGEIVALSSPSPLRSNEEPASAETKSSKPDHFRLAQNYPNPFNSGTTISYSVPRSGRVRITVYDILGRERAVIFDKNIDPGDYDIAWQPNGLASGVYYYRITADGFSDTKKMLLLR